MKRFLDDNFLLSGDMAQRLYHEVAAHMPIVDYHCHIDAKDIYEDRRFENITQVWLAGDHYKWRMMRSNGVEEKYVTGDAPDREKFQQFAQALPRAIGNPMYHWCHLELKNYFGYEGVLNGDTAEEVWQLAERKLREPSFSARGLITQSNVEMIGTTDDPTADLHYHKLLAEEGFATRVLPSFRPDKALNLHKTGFADYIAALAKAADMDIRCADDVCLALTRRIEYFDAHGCRAADHGLDYVTFRVGTDEQINAAFAAALAGEPLTVEQIEAYQTKLLLHCAREYHRLGWVMQLHFSCMRNPNSRMMATLGPDSGFDCIAVTKNDAALYALMDALYRDGQLPKTILYSLNPADDAWIDTLLGAFQDSTVRGKIQHGSAWWFNDNKVGMIHQLTSLANLSVLGNFVGMLTDSRSLLSYARHEYFRRILCELIGTWVDNGEYPNDFAMLRGLVEDICYRNAKQYFDI